MERRKPYELVISDMTKHMMESHVRFLALRNVDASRRIKNSIIQAIATLRENPERFPFLDVHGIPRNIYRKLFVKNWYLVLFQIQGQEVLVEYIVDCRSDYKWLLE